MTGPETPGSDAPGPWASGSADGIFYDIHGRREPGAPAVIFSAGLGGLSKFWEPQVRGLEACCRVVMYDHRGTGRSRSGPMAGPVSIAGMARDVLTLCDTLAIERAHLVGHALGGLIGLELAITAPDRIGRLVVVNGWSRPDAHLARCMSVRLDLLRNSGAAAYLRAQPLFLYPASWISANAARLEADERAGLGHFPEPAVMASRIQALLAFDRDADLGRIAAPTLIAGSRDDMLVPHACSERLAERIPGARLFSQPWGGHAFTVTAPDDFDPALRDFLLE